MKNKKLTIGIRFGGYTDENERLMDRAELNKRIAGLRKAVTSLERRLDQQMFNNKHNLSIDQPIADKIKSQERKIKRLEKENNKLKWEVINLTPIGVTRDKQD